MFKLKKRPLKTEKTPPLYNVLENYTDFDPPGNVMVCGMTGEEDLATHAKVLGESYDIPVETMTNLLSDGGVYVYPETGALVTRGLFACKVDLTGETPKWTWVLDLPQYMEAEQLVRSLDVTLAVAAERVLTRTLPEELQDRLKEKNLGLDYTQLDRSVTRGGDIAYIDFRKDWSPHFKRKCTMPDGSMVETGGLQEFATLHGITETQAKQLMEEGGILEIDEGVLACQVINNQPTVARFNKKQYAKAKDIAESQNLHIMDALSEMALNDPVLVRALRRMEG
ncbi:MAG: hypothetical protein GKS05_06830 [Nitrospirales bacterium]|nr:hypothetical protein [Nitrospirales bacterium]